VSKFRVWSGHGRFEHGFTLLVAQQLPSCGNRDAGSSGLEVIDSQLVVSRNWCVTGTTKHSGLSFS
jgi:hypothetical protein